MRYQSKIPVASGARSFDRYSNSHDGSFDQKRKRSGLDVDARDEKPVFE